MKKFETKFEDRRFEIEEDLPEAGWYIYVYNKDNQCIYDYLQDTEAIAKEFAFEEFGVPKENWVEIK